MGAWGHQSFENDDALDWVGDLQEKGISLIADTFSDIPDDTAVYVEAPAACSAIAAAEVVAALGGKPAIKLPLGLAEWLNGKAPPTPALIQRARRALDRILSVSELRDLWEEGDSLEWKREMEDLRMRLI